MSDWREEIRDMADNASRDWVTLGNAGDFTGVVWLTDLPNGTILDPAKARALGAQLILQADLHEAIQSNAYDRGVGIMQAELQKTAKSTNRLLEDLRKHLYDNGGEGSDKLVDRIDSRLESNKKSDGRNVP
jgi:hypothetical protein